MENPAKQKEHQAPRSKVVIKSLYAWVMGFWDCETNLSPKRKKSKEKRLVPYLQNRILLHIDVALFF